MRLSVDINDRGGLAVGAHLKRIGTRAGDLRPASETVHGILMRAIDYQYGRGGPAVGGWKPDAASTVARKQRLGLDVRVMHETRRLRLSLTTAGHPDHIWQVTRSGMLLSTRTPYAQHLQAGGRPPVIVSQSAADRASAAIRDWLLEAPK